LKDQAAKIRDLLLVLDGRSVRLPAHPTLGQEIIRFRRGGDSVGHMASLGWKAGLLAVLAGGNFEGASKLRKGWIYNTT
jgi:hypothetical protein